MDGRAGIPPGGEPGAAPPRLGHGGDAAAPGGGTEGRNPATRDLDLLDALGVCRAMHREDLRAVEAVGRVLDRVALAAERVAAALASGGRLFYVGAGTSGRLGALDAVECPPTFGLAPDRVQAIVAGGRDALWRAAEGAEDDRRAGAADVAAADVRAGDAVVGLAASGRTPYVLGAVAEARRRGAWTAGVLCNPGAPLAAAVDLAVVVDTGPEVLTGSTRLKAGTAQKLVLNMISTAAMVRLGRVYSNLMVDMVPSNAKLRERAVRTVCEATGCGPAEARAALEAAGWRVKTAVVVAGRGVSAAEAEALLTAAGGSVRRVLEGPRPRGNPSRA